MNIHEHQAKALLAEYGVPVPRGKAVFSVDDAVAAARELGGPVCVVKAQIHAGGRGKAGGVKVVQSQDQLPRSRPLFLAKRLLRTRPGQRAARCAACILRMDATSLMSCISQCLLIGAAAG